MLISESNFWTCKHNSGFKKINLFKLCAEYRGLWKRWYPPTMKVYSLWTLSLIIFMVLSIVSKFILRLEITPLAVSLGSNHIYWVFSAPPPSPKGVSSSHSLNFSSTITPMELPTYHSKTLVPSYHQCLCFLPLSYGVNLVGTLVALLVLLTFRNHLWIKLTFAVNFYTYYFYCRVWAPPPS